VLKRLAATSVFVTISRMITTGTNLAVIFIVSRNLGTTNLGVYSICFALMYLTYTLTSFNLEVFLGKEMAIARGNRQRMADLAGTTIAGMAAGTLAALTVMGISRLIYTDVPTPLLILATLCGFLLGLDMNLNGLLLGQERAHVETGTNLGASLVLLLPLALWPGKTGLTGIFWLRAAGLATAIAFKMAILRPAFINPSLRSPGRIFREIRYYWFDHVAGYFLRQADILLLALFVDLDELGVYFLALRIFLAAGIIGEVSARALVPFFSRTYHGMETLSMGRLLRRMLAASLGVGVLLGLSLALFGGWAISLFKPAIDSGEIWLRWLSLAVPLRLGRFILSAFLSSSRYQKQLFMVHLVSAAILIVLTLTLGVTFLSAGVLTARLFSELFGFLFCLAVVFYRLPDSRKLRQV